MSVNSFIGKAYYRCGMCHSIETTDLYEWVGDITKTKLNICSKCAKREIGGKVWQKKSLQLKKLKLK